jgi:predicted acyltransferase
MNPTPPPDTQRLRSLDALRGFDMFWIIGGDELGRALSKWYYGTEHNWVYEQLVHVPWEGFRFYDLIYPLFMLLVGAVIPFSLGSLERRGAPPGVVYGRILRRVVLLFALGLLCNEVMQFEWPFRIAGVLQRIAICYGIAAVIAYTTGTRGQIMTLAAILVGYWALLSWLPNPETGVAGDLSPERNVAGYLDRHYLPGKILKEYYGHGDNEGYLSTIPSVATVLLGVLAGRWLRSSAGALTKTVVLALAGAACLALGELWASRFPVIKNLWTSTFVLTAGGWSLLLLALFYGVIDGLRWQAWTFPFVVIGVNAITIYVVPNFVDFRHLSDFFLGGVIRRSGDLGPAVHWTGVLAAQWLFLLFLYRQRLFLRV